jgi:hypothetical protein
MLGNSCVVLYACDACIGSNADRKVDRVFFFRLMWLNSDQRGGETERNVAFIENGTSIEWRRNTIYKLVYEP